MVRIKQTPAYAVYKMSKLIDQSTAALDPLGLDHHFADTFHSMSQEGSAREMKDFIEAHLNALGYDYLLGLNEVEAMAATRDLALFAAALTKLGMPVSQVPSVEMLLVRLAEKTREVPADTVFSYGTRNPDGPRRRMFTGTSEERAFIHSFTDGMNGLLVTIAGLETIHDMDISDPRYAEFVREAASGMEQMTQAILAVRKKITPDFFTSRLRPFFEPKTLQGKTYFAPGGAQMPLTMVDMILWGAEDRDKSYLTYRNENFQYLPVAFRGRIEVMLRKPSIIQNIRLIDGRGGNSTKIHFTEASLGALIELMEQIIRFRGPHLGVAKANMRIRPAGSVGSGGYEVAILEYLVSKTKEAKSLLVTTKKQLCE